MIEFVTASHDVDIIRANLLRSHIFLNRKSPPLSIVTGYSNISAAYNSIKKTSEYICYVHHDVYLPVFFEQNLKNALEEMAVIDPNWGVLGVAGVKFSGTLKENVGYIQDRGREWGSPRNLPRTVQTLDELLLITKGDLKFDEQFDLHFYGADICMQANLQLRNCYAIDAYCHHNSGLPLGYRSDSFKACEKKFRDKYIDNLPIITTCSTLT